MSQKIYPVITLYQPWATWIIRGWKLIETRLHEKFKSLKGKRILIHAGMKTDSSDEVIYNPYLSREQILHNPDEVINGAIIGECLVEDFGILDESHSRYALIDCGSVTRYGLFLNEIMKVEPISVKGEMGIWYFNTETNQKSSAAEYYKEQIMISIHSVQSTTPN